MQIKIKYQIKLIVVFKNKFIISEMYYFYYLINYKRDYSFIRTAEIINLKSK